MNDDQIEAALRAGPPDEPRYHMAASAVRPRPRSRASIASVLAPVLTLAVVIVVVSTILRPRATDDAEVALPGDIQAAGVLRVGVSVEAPQLTGAGGTQGFDVDVAQEVGRRLGITVQVSAASLRQLLLEPDRWDLILATGPAGPDPDGLAAGEPYLWRSGALVRRSDDPILSLEDVAGQTACVPLGGAATTWLESRLPVDAVSEPSPELTVVTEPSLTDIAIVNRPLSQSCAL